MTRTSGVGADTLDQETAPELTRGLNLLVKIQASIGQLASELKRQNDQTQQMWRGVRPLTNIVVPQITTSTGSADYPDLLAPRTGYWWDVKLAGAFTFTVGSVNLYLTGTQDSNIVGAFPQAGYLTYGSQQLLFNWNSRLVFKAVSTTGNVSPNLSVVEVADWALPSYLI